MDKETIKERLKLVWTEYKVVSVILLCMGALSEVALKWMSILLAVAGL